MKFSFTYQKMFIFSQTLDLNSDDLENGVFANSVSGDWSSLIAKKV